ncbi:radical SAM protein [Clostridiales bacterium PH28_bin88]|nr:radical SAM protein [Clostridiales bacterium PH28_bin88]
MNLAETYVGEKLLEQGVKVVLRNPEKNLVKLVHWAGKIARDPYHRQAVGNVKRFLEDKDSNWYQFAQRVLKQTRPSIRERLAINFFINATFLGIPKQREMGQKLGMGVPWAILMDPTERCNLQCKGCWAGDYQRKEELDLATMDRICREAEGLGIYFFVISGGEPLVRKQDLLELAARHTGTVFHVFSNGTLVDTKFAEESARLGNITLALSIEGLEETTDHRRGKGVFQKVIRAMEMLRDYGVVYGFSTTYTRENAEEVGSNEFIDLMVEKGATFGWYFTYTPIGKDVDLSYMATPAQRAYVYERILHFRKTKPIFLVDFWNDGEYSNGCIAGGRRYFHINAAGDVEPCAFVHYATCNIRDMTLVEALQNPLFKAYQKRQPFNDNPRRPCPLIDNPEALREMVKETGARPTQLHQDAAADEFADRMAPYAAAWGEMADSLRALSHTNRTIRASRGS